MKIQRSSNIHNRDFCLLCIYLHLCFTSAKTEFHGTIVYTVVCVLYVYWHLCRFIKHIACAYLCVFAQARDVHYGLLIFSTFQSKVSKTPKRSTIQKNISITFPYLFFVCIHMKLKCLFFFLSLNLFKNLLFLEKIYFSKDTFIKEYAILFFIWHFFFID